MKKALTIEETQRAVCRMSEAIIENEPYLTELDQKIGDGDHGINMKLGFTSVKDTLLSHTYDSINQVFYETGIALIKSMGGASGVIFGTLFIGGMKDMPAADVLDAKFLADYMEHSLQSIQRRGKAEFGQKTMLDALGPAVKALEKYRDEPLEKALEAASEAACKGAGDTRNMIPGAGRSRQYAEKALGHADSGAVSTAILFEAFYKCVSKEM
ncbi:dihydroxyacetone kinase subunit L [Clostridium sp. AF19-22AC]|jgi:dihydroxyacetone kinase-like protein|uniref:dihydroxyacetone kinase subunit DhaL n=1 Tax=Clostridia TaxID=186801 RepID=UPI000E4D1413|nr:MULTISPECIES: dihydroxyacetone kinase subunit DhaL [Clostridia]RHR21587.1 dihydroxyacetone kinase subunit L [Clostridium sp. AF19-22AC]